MRRIQAFSIASGGVASRDLGWGSAAFKVAQQVKVQMFADLLALGFDALLADIDAVFLRDPLPYLACLPEADVLVSSDHLHNSTTDGGLELPTSAHATMNVGILYSRARPGPLAFMREWARRCSANLDFWEQAIFNEMAKQKPGLDTSNSTLAPRRLFAFWGRRLVGGILPVSLFCSGHTGFVQKMHAKLGFNAPYALHATFQYSGTRGKIERFREAGAWVDSAAYYAPQGGLLRFQPALPPELTRAPWVGVADTERHLALVATQMAAVRDAWALAQALGRTLLMPRLVCGYDRYWAGMPEGKIPGSALSLPIEACPMDHLFELERWPQPEAAFREWSLLDNERTPESVKASVSVASLAALPAGRALSAALLDAGANLSARCDRGAADAPPCALRSGLGLSSPPIAPSRLAPNLPSLPAVCSTCRRCRTTPRCSPSPRSGASSSSPSGARPPPSAATRAARRPSRTPCRSARHPTASARSQRRPRRAG